MIKRKNRWTVNNYSLTGDTAVHGVRAISLKLRARFPIVYRVVAGTARKGPHLPRVSHWMIYSKCSAMRIGAREKIVSVFLTRNVFLRYGMIILIHASFTRRLDTPCRGCTTADATAPFSFLFAQSIQRQIVQIQVVHVPRKYPC